MTVKVISYQFMYSMTYGAPAQVEKVQCCADVMENSDYGKSWREQMVKKKIRRYSKSERVMQCIFNAVVEIDGVPMCRRHAGVVALNLWVNGLLIEKEEKP